MTGQNMKNMTCQNMKDMTGQNMKDLADQNMKDLTDQNMKDMTGQNMKDMMGQKKSVCRTSQEIDGLNEGGEKARKLNEGMGGRKQYNRPP